MGKKAPTWTRAAEAGADTHPTVVEWVSVDDLHFAPEYQRELRESTVEFLVNNYRAREVGTIVVSRRSDGSLWVVDGQHRVAALRHLGIGVVRAEIHVGLSIVEEANLFEHLNRNRRAPSVFDLFRAQLAGQRPEAVQIVAIAAEFGYDFRRGGGAYRPNSIDAVGAVEAIYRQGGPGRLRAVLAITSGPWAGHREGIEGQMLRGLAMFLRSYEADPAYSPERLHDVLSRRAPVEILRDARRIAVETGRAGATNGYAPYVLALREVYNRGLGSTSRRRLGYPRVNDRSLPEKGRIGRTR